MKRLKVWLLAAGSFEDHWNIMLTRIFNFFPLLKSNEVRFECVTRCFTAGDALLRSGVLVWTIVHSFVQRNN